MGREEEVVYDPPQRRKARAPLEEQKLYCPESHTAQRSRPIRGLGNERRELRKRETENVLSVLDINEANTKGAQES